MPTSPRIRYKGRGRTGGVEPRPYGDIVGDVGKESPSHGFAVPAPFRQGGREDGGCGCPCCGAQNFCAALRLSLKILTAATRSPRFFCHWQRSVCSPRARCALAMTYFLHGVRFSGPMWASAPTQGGFLCLLESGTGKVCRPPPPRRLEMAIMLSMESMRHHGAWQQKITRPPKAAG